MYLVEVRLFSNIYDWIKDFSVDQPFVQLPLVTPGQIELSRKIPQFFTGDLEAPVRYNTAFAGVEKHLLRAQIQRISAGTQVDSFRYYFSWVFLGQIGPKNSINEEESTDEETIERKIDRYEWQ